MNILVTGGCGFVGTNVALFLKRKKYKITSLDNLSRKGSFFNLKLLKEKKIRNFRIDISNFKRINELPKYDLIIDCCAEAAVEVSRKEMDRVLNTNLIGTFNILKKAKKDKSKIIFLSSSRVYPINFLKNQYNLKNFKKKIYINKKVNEKDSLKGFKTIYGVSKLASEMLIEEFNYAYNIKYLINRCGVIAGPLQFGKQDQGFVSHWIWKHINKMKLSYIGFGGYGNQTRDVLHIDDLCNLLWLQIKKFSKINNKTFVVGGSSKSYTSLKNLTLLCQKITNNKIHISRKPKTSIYDIPCYISDNKEVSRTYKWEPKNNIYNVVKDTYIWLSENKKNIKKYF